MQQHAFDSYAKSYDAHFTNSLIGKAQRQIIHGYLKKYLHKDKSVLEINCGTGEDALFISGSCKSILATDISEEMLEVAKEKLMEVPNGGTQKLDITNLSLLTENQFDLLFSNFGGINCLAENEVTEFAEASAKVLSENGEAILVIMPEKCVWESVYFSLKGSNGKAFRRGNKEGVPTEINGAFFKTYYYSPARIKIFFEKYFETIKVLPVGFFVPPSYLDPFFAKRKACLSVMEGFEKLSSGLSFLSSYSDHYLIHLKKKST
jgi:ubiquinone/menaquinone biosynthesis C-methylase UbiE